MYFPPLSAVYNLIRMNQKIQKLLELSEKESRRIIGLMSGTSLDGLDIALCKISGSGLNTQLTIEKFETVSYTEEVKNDIRGIFSRQQIDLQKLTLLNAKIGQLHASLVLSAMKQWGVHPEDIDCIASHGQTIYHAPKRLHKLENYPDATLQIGDGDHIAVNTGIITLSDFRQKNIAGGGEGAPLAIYGDYILFSCKDENRILLNIGGIANFTKLPATGVDVICSDLGPGNTLTDALCMQYFNKPFDPEGSIARSGKVSGQLLETMLAHPFFLEEFPKTTGPELFNTGFIEAARAASGLDLPDPRDLIATATALTAKTITLGIKKTILNMPFTLYVSGGGCHNSYLMEQIQNELPSVAVRLTEELGINPDAKEAALFALLANETLCGSKVCAGIEPSLTMGKISLPD